VKVLRIPAVWPDRPDMVAHARLYYTLDRLGVADQEATAAFHAVRDEGRDLSSEEKVLRRAGEQGLDVEAVRTAYESQEVSDAVEAAPALRERYQVAEQPSPPSAKGYESRCTMPFGETLPIPAPFDCGLDTTGFQVPEQQPAD
jgi:hypothetical protein